MHCYGSCSYGTNVIETQSQAAQLSAETSSSNPNRHIITDRTGEHISRAKADILDRTLPSRHVQDCQTLEQQHSRTGTDICPPPDTVTQMARSPLTNLTGDTLVVPDNGTEGLKSVYLHVVKSPR